MRTVRSLLALSVAIIALVAAANRTAVAFSAAWLFASPWGVELMATAPVEHDVYFDAGKVALFRHAPIALTLQRRFLDPNGRVQAHLGAGVAYSTSFGERTVGALELDPYAVGLVIGGRLR